MSVKNDIMEPVNKSDKDPISLTNIDDISCLWYYKFNNKIYAYDAWCWLEYFQVSRKYIHPVFKNDLNLADVHSIYTTCKQYADRNDISLEQKQLLNSCQSKKVITTKQTDPEGNIIGAKFVPQSPLFVFQVVDVQDKYKGNLKTPIKCTAKITYVLYDYTGEPSNPVVHYI